MPSVKSFKILLLSAVGCLGAAACSLPAPGVPDGGFMNVNTACKLSADAGVVDFGSSVVATGDVENVIPVTTCPPPGSTNPNPNAIDKYSHFPAQWDPKLGIHVT